MSRRVNHINKKTGITYVYEYSSYWDKEKKQARNSQVCIGKIDPASGDFIASKRLAPEQAAVRDPAVTAYTQIIGPSLILDAITDRLGLSKLLKICFPDNYKKIMTMAYYLVADGGALSHCSNWCKSHAPTMTDLLTSQRISEVLTSITFDQKQTFFSKWMRQVLDGDFLCYDITSVSSYSELNEYIKYGYNRDKERLPQLNLAVLFGQNGRLPVYFERLPGSITDVTTLHNLLKSFKAMELKKLSYVMDKGFYSKKNIDELCAANDKFLIAVPLSNKWLQHAIEGVADKIHGPEGYHKLDNEAIYVRSMIYPWGEKKRRCYVHLYYNAHARANAIDEFNEKLLMYKAELESGELNPKHSKAYDTYFIIKTTPKRGKQVKYNTDEINKYIKKYSGFQSLLTNSIKDPIKALHIYRDKDVVEKCFDDLKNQLDMKRLRMHSSATTDGRLFVQFVALIYVSALRKEISACKPLECYTARELLQEMGTLTKITYSGKHGNIITEKTKKQQEIMGLLKIAQ